MLFILLVINSLVILILAKSILGLSKTDASNVMCLTYGGPTTSFYGECINEPCLNSSYVHPTITSSVDPESMIFNNTLKLNARTSGYYVCITRSETVSTLATLLTGFSRGI